MLAVETHRFEHCRLRGRAHDLDCLVLEGALEMAECGTLIAYGHPMLGINWDDAVECVLDVHSGDLVGVLCWHVSPAGEAKVSMLYVEPSSRRRGLATELFRRLLKELKGTGCNEVQMRLHSDNAGGRRWADSLGLVFVGDALYSRKLVSGGQHVSRV